MAFGIGAGPRGAEYNQTTFHVYDAHDGRILATFQFVGAAKEFDEKFQQTLASQAQKSSNVPIERIAVLGKAEIPNGEGVLHVDTAARKLIRKAQFRRPMQA